jgi:hypothetical protein
MIKNNNPGNLRDSGIDWVGLDSPRADEHGFCRFKALADGASALVKDLHNQPRLHGMNTVNLIIEKFAPPSENNTAAYKADVSERLKVSPDQVIDLQNPLTLLTLARSISHHETGDFLDDIDLQGIVNSVIGINAESSKGPVMPSSSVSQTAATSLGTAAGGSVLLWFLASIKAHELILPDTTTALILSGSIAPFLHALGRAVLKKLGAGNPTETAGVNS